MVAKDEDGTVRAELEALDARLPGLRRRVLDNDGVLEAIEEELAAAELAERRQQRRRAELSARKAELWERLVKLQNERDALKDLEQELERETDKLVDRDALRKRYRAVAATGQQVERELAEARARRRDLAARLTGVEHPPEDEKVLPLRLVKASAPPPPPPPASQKK